MFCIHCGTKLPDEAKFCSSCGQSVMAAAEKEEFAKTPQKKTTPDRKMASDNAKHVLTISEKLLTVRKSYIISDGQGNVIYTARNEGLPNVPEIGLFDDGGSKVGYIVKKIFGNPALGNPAYTMHYDGDRIGSVLQRFSLKPKFEIPELGWSVEIGPVNGIAYGANGEIVAQVRYIVSKRRNTFFVEYYGEKNQINAIMLALLKIIVLHY